MCYCVQKKEVNVFRLPMPVIIAADTTTAGASNGVSSISEADKLLELSLGWIGQLEHVEDETVCDVVGSYL